MSDYIKAVAKKRQSLSKDKGQSAKKQLTYSAVEIKRDNGSVIVSYDVNDQLLPEFRFRAALEAAVRDKVDLSNVDLSGHDLNYAMLGFMHAPNAKMIQTKCHHTCFSYSDLRGANVHNSDFTEAQFVDANLSGCHIISSEFTDADFKYADVVGTYFLGDDPISGADFTDAKGWKEATSRCFGSTGVKPRFRWIYPLALAAGMLVGATAILIQLFGWVN